MPVPRLDRSRITAVRVIVAACLLYLSPLVRAEQTIGLFLNEPEAYDGYTLFARV